MSVEPALVEALRSGRLADYCADVLAVEPPAADQPALLARLGNRGAADPAHRLGQCRGPIRLRDEVVANLAAWRGGERRNRVA